METLLMSIEKRVAILEKMDCNPLYLYARHELILMGASP